MLKKEFANWYKNKLTFKIKTVQKDLVIDTMKNACDLSLPLKSLGYLPNVNPAFIAFLGTMSSLFGIFPLVNPEYKLPWGNEYSKPSQNRICFVTFYFIISGHNIYKCYQNISIFPDVNGYIFGILTHSHEYTYNVCFLHLVSME